MRCRINKINKHDKGKVSKSKETQDLGFLMKNGRVENIDRDTGLNKPIGDLALINAYTQH